jgi:hypothetical protein
MTSRWKVFGQFNAGAPGIGEEGNLDGAIGHLVNRLVELDAIRFQIYYLETDVIQGPALGGGQALFGFPKRFAR